MRMRVGSVRGGFTLLELLIVMVIGAALLTMAIPNFTRVSAGQNARNARDAVVWMSARARSRAIERGQVMLLEIDPASERAWIVFRRQTGSAVAADTLEKTNFATEQSVQISGPSNKVTLCYNSRGYAFACTGTSATTNVDVVFTHAGRSATARLKPLGQVERL